MNVEPPFSYSEPRVPHGQRLVQLARAQGGGNGLGRTVDGWLQVLDGSPYLVRRESLVLLVLQLAGHLGLSDQVLLEPTQGPTVTALSGSALCCVMCPPACLLDGRFDRFNWQQRPIRACPLRGPRVPPSLLPPASGRALA